MSWRISLHWGISLPRGQRASTVVGVLIAILLVGVYFWFIATHWERTRVGVRPIPEAMFSR